MVVRWETLTLTGFGRYSDTAEINFAPKLSLCIGGNEHGKSTLAAGIAAVIYGMPSTADPRAFGQGRFRNWSGPARFEGTLTFAARGGQYRIFRNFDNHRVSLQRLDDQGWQEEVGGEHNPGARKPNVHYEKKIAQLLGMSSRDVFFATFFVGQPLPEGDTILPEIGRLLSGAGTHFKEALTTLAVQAKEITRYSGRLGITTQDMRQDRELEKLEAEIEATKTALWESDGLLTELQQTAATLTHSRQQLSVMDKELAGKERLLEAWQEWRTLRDRYSDALLRQRGLDTAWQQGKEIYKAQTVREKRLADQYARYLPFPDDVGDALTTLSLLTDEANVLAKEKAEVEQQLNLAKEATEQAENLLSEYRDVRGRPELLRDCRELQSKIAQESALSRKRTEVENRLADLENQLSAMPPWYTLGKSPQQRVGELQRATGEVQQQWQEISEIEKRLMEREQSLDEEFALFNQGDPETLITLASYNPTRLHLAGNVQAAEQKQRHAQQRVEELQALYSQFRKRYLDLEHLGVDALPLVEKKLERVAQQKNNPMPGIGPLIMCLLVALTVGAVVFSLSQLLWAGGATFVTIFILAWFLLQQRSSQRQGSIHTDLANASALELGEIRLRLQERTRQEVELQTKQATLPSEAALQAMAAEVTAAQEEHNRFMEQAKPFIERYPHPADAYARWRDCVREVAGDKKEIIRFLERYPGRTGLSHLAAASPEQLPSPWPALAQLAGLSEGETDTVAELLVWLDQADWSKIFAEAGRFEQLQEEKRAAEAERSMLFGDTSVGAARFTRLREEINELHAAAAPFDEKTDLESLATRINTCQTLESQWLQQSSRMQEAERKLTSLTEKMVTVQEKVNPLAAQLAPLLDGGEPLDQIISTWQESRSVKLLRDQDEKELSAVLRVNDTATLDELQIKNMDAANRAQGILQAWENLLLRHPGLPGVGQGDPALLEEQYRTLSLDVQHKREEKTALGSQVRDLEFTQARLQGKSPINIAASRERLLLLLEGQARLKREAAALQVAYRELSAAIVDYSGSYRRELAEKASGYLQKITDVLQRYLVVDESFNVGVREDGRDIAVTQLSQGARDQLYIALRLAIADLLSHDIPLPFIFDDPFLNWDEGRLEQIRQLLIALSEDRQIILLSHNSVFAPWGDHCEIKVAKS
jgi:uncharacterized protein YhaN